MTAKQIEELFELTSSHGLTLVSKAAPHGRWRINVLVPDGARLQSSKKGGTCDKELCSVDAETPLQAVQDAPQ